jgi:cell volume regulation protein A
MSVLTDPAQLNVVLAATALVVLIAVRLAASAVLPSLLLYLALGLAIGEAGLGLQFDDVEVTRRSACSPSP